ncbi:hypothetical protein BW723_00285 [Polaribacter reichenbachii]|uniref:Porin n=1 Tax=Polaribacter reichenbachii TaxID=996801 RepID=A0A1B8U2D8_9FLAO|nr:hypothetical protein [Polaribacter reichenbachii]APZ44819.1 hypothetical protein BW723_00285 [Polaribacter reichenbachii]AUC18683.1 hypothetical protein BTO17_08290 [Polaribacter reichenbachii]OBY66012.1 hypothetical protein LPB301_07505 [Polaribacter reichenbachii]
MVILKKVTVIALMLLGLGIYAQENRDLDNYRYTDKRGVNVFEAPKSTETSFKGLKVRFGGASTLQFQGIDHENSDLAGIELQPIGSNFNLATANLDIDVALYDGVRMHLRTFLSSRHHHETYVKGGYFQIDKLDFVKEGFMEDFMKYATLKVGHMENNYGDAHFRRSDNAQAMHNPFVGNLIMDSYTTEVGAELLVQKNGFIGMLGVTNGKLNQSVDKTSEDGSSGGASFLAKLGYDKQINTDLRVRITGSMYNTGYVPNSYLYAGDRGGSRYYGVMIADAATADNFRSGRYNPNLKNKISAIMFNPFIKYKGLEFFGTIETASGKATAELENRTANQFAGELIYRFGKEENLYIGGRYNSVDSEEMTGEDVTIKRSQLVAGWFLTKNILMKMEYVNQKYEGFATTSTLNQGKFNGVILEAAISF